MGWAASLGMLGLVTSRSCLNGSNNSSEPYIEHVTACNAGGAAQHTIRALGVVSPLVAIAKSIGKALAIAERDSTTAGPRAEEQASGVKALE